jgi:hypothetical protein
MLVAPMERSLSVRQPGIDAVSTMRCRSLQPFPVELKHLGSPLVPERAVDSCVAHALIGEPVSTSPEHELAREGGEESSKARPAPASTSGSVVPGATISLMTEIRLGFIGFPFM